MLQLMVAGITIGSIYALAAVGFILIYNATRAVNFAHGDLIMLGGFTAVVLTHLFSGVLPFVVIVLLSVLAMVVIGAVLYLIAYRPLLNKPFLSVFVSTLAVGIVIRNATRLSRGSQPASLDPIVAGDLAVADIKISWQSLAVIGIAAGLIFIQRWTLSRTAMGRLMRATAQDYEMARILGVRVSWIHVATFAIASVLAGVAGILIAPVTFLTVDMGMRMILMIYIAVVIGGFGNLTGALLGSILLGLVEVFSAAYLGAAFQTISVFLLLLIFLLLRPQGFLGETPTRRA